MRGKDANTGILMLDADAVVQVADVVLVRAPADSMRLGLGYVPARCQHSVALSDYQGRTEV